MITVKNSAHSAKRGLTMLRSSTTPLSETICMSPRRWWGGAERKDQATVNMPESVRGIAEQIKDNCNILHIRQCREFVLRRSALDLVIIQAGFVRSITTAPLDSKTGLRLARLLAPARMIVMDLFSFAPSLASAVSLARMALGFAEKKKPLRRETVRERSSSYADFLSSPKIIDGLVLDVEK